MRVVERAISFQFSRMLCVCVRERGGGGGGVIHSLILLKTDKKNPYLRVIIIINEMMNLQIQARLWC